MCVELPEVACSQPHIKAESLGVDAKNVHV